MERVMEIDYAKVVHWKPIQESKYGRGKNITNVVGSVSGGQGTGVLVGHEQFHSLRMLQSLFANSTSLLAFG